MATTNSSSVLRFSGMNSGLDTESIVNAMTAATKLKITKQNRKAITLKWKQEAYQLSLIHISEPTRHNY